MNNHDILTDRGNYCLSNFNEDEYSTAEVCRILEISKPTLFRWEKLGIIGLPDRDYKGYRVWKRNQILELLHYKTHFGRTYKRRMNHD